MVEQLIVSNIGRIAKLFRIGLIVQILRFRCWIRQSRGPCACALLEVGAARVDAIEEAVPEFVSVVRRLFTGSCPDHGKARAASELKRAEAKARASALPEKVRREIDMVNS